MKYWREWWPRCVVVFTQYLSLYSFWLLHQFHSLPPLYTCTHIPIYCCIICVVFVTGDNWLELLLTDRLLLVNDLGIGFDCYDGYIDDANTATGSGGICDGAGGALWWFGSCLVAAMEVVILGKNGEKGALSQKKIQSHSSTDEIYHWEIRLKSRSDVRQPSNRSALWLPNAVFTFT